MLGDLNGWAGDRLREGITGGFGVPGENNGRRVIDFCAENNTLNTKVCISTPGWLKAR